MDYSELVDIRNKIEGLTNIHQIEILRILHKASIPMNENQYGVHINLASVTPETITEMTSYLRYVSEQELNLSRTEQQKDEFRKEFKNIHIGNNT
jgi:hypothetical protein